MKKKIQKITSNIVAKFANRRVKIKYFAFFLSCLVSLIALIKVTLDFHSKFNNKASLQSPQTIVMESEKDKKPKSSFVLDSSTIITIEYGKNIFSQFTDNGFSSDEVRQAINELNLHYDMRKLKPGDKFVIKYDSEFYYEEKIKINNKKQDKNNIKNKEYKGKKNLKQTEDVNQKEESITEEPKEKVFEKKEKRKIKVLFFKDNINNKKITITLNEETGKYETSVVRVQLKKEIKLEKITIKNSIFADAISVISSQAIYKILNEYAFSVDFQRDIQKNDKLNVLIEYTTDEDGNKRDEKILYANLILNKKDNEIFRYKDSFYNKDGKSSSKSLLLSPVDGARISSRFSLNRMHPVLGYSRAHLGIDFAAPVGTPIYAAGDGTITFVGWKGGFGKMISIRHNSEFSTNYGHMSRFNKHSKIGARVKQRDIIGYIGITGLTSGPHVHYELVRNGRKINPRIIRGIASKKLNKLEMDAFKQVVLETEDRISKL